MTLIYIAIFALLIVGFFGRSIGRGLKPVLIILFALWAIGTMFGPSKPPAEQQTATTAP